MRSRRLLKPQKTLVLRAVLATLAIASTTSVLAASNYLIGEDITAPESWSLSEIYAQDAANIINRAGFWGLSTSIEELEFGPGLYIGNQPAGTGSLTITYGSSDFVRSFIIDTNDTDPERPELDPSIDPSIRVGDAGGNGTLTVHFEPIEFPPTLTQGRLYASDIGLGVGLGGGSTGHVRLLGSGKTQGSWADRSQNNFYLSSARQNSLIGQSGGQGTVEIQGAGLTIAPSLSTEDLHYFFVGDGDGSSGNVDILSNGKLTIGDSYQFFTPDYVGADELPISFAGTNGGQGTITVGPSEADEQNIALFNYGLALGQTGGNGTLNVLQGGKSVVSTGTMLNTDKDRCLANEASGYPRAPASLQISANNDALGTARASGHSSDLLVAGKQPVDRSGFEPYYIATEAIGKVLIGTGGTLLASDSGRVQVGVTRIIDDGSTIRQVSVGGLGPIIVTGQGHVVYGSDTSSPTAAGHIEASLIDLQSTQAQLRFNHNGSLNFDRPIAGSGKLSQLAGTTTISATLATLPELEPDFFAFPTIADCIPEIATTGYPTTQDSFAGSLDVQGGTLILPATNVLQNLSSTLVSGGTLMMGSTDQNLGNVELPGGVLQLTGGLEPSATNTASAGSWSGGNGMVQLDTELGDDSSASDKLVITGAISGTTALQISNFGGLGAQTTGAGILVVEASQSNGANSFVLAGPVTRGSFQYRLQQTGNNWYLVSSPYIAPPQQATPVPLLSWLGLLGMGTLLAAVSGGGQARSKCSKARHA